MVSLRDLFGMRKSADAIYRIIDGMKRYLRAEPEAINLKNYLRLVKLEEAFKHTLPNYDDVIVVGPEEVEPRAATRLPSYGSSPIQKGGAELPRPPTYSESEKN